MSTQCLKSIGLPSISNSLSFILVLLHGKLRNMYHSKALILLHKNFSHFLGGSIPAGILATKIDPENSDNQIGNSMSPKHPFSTTALFLLQPWSRSGRYNLRLLLYVRRGGNVRKLLKIFGLSSNVATLTWRETSLSSTCGII